MTRARGRTRPPSPPLPGSRRLEALTALSFLVATVAGFALLAVYVNGGQTQVEGLLLCLCLGGIGTGIVLWQAELMEIHDAVEERHTFASPAADDAMSEVLSEERGFTRRRLLIVAMLSSFAGLAAALVVPLFSLGPAPGRQLFLTPWRKGLRLVGIDGKPIHRGDLDVGGILTVFPEDHVGEADAATLLIRLEPSQLHLAADRLALAPEGYIALSKVCTHAGCPVGLYRASERQLICPCHQSTFDVARGAVPIFGPAARPLPQLPIELQADGTFVATGPYPEPIGPSFWNMTDGSTQ